MNCDKARNLISCYIDRELNKQEQMQLQTHFAECPSCRIEFEEMQELVEILNTIPLEELPSDFHTELMHQIGTVKMENVPTKKKHHFSSWKSFAAIAAAFFMVLIVGGGLGNLIQNNEFLNLTGNSYQSTSEEAMPQTATADGGYSADSDEAIKSRAYSEAPQAEVVMGNQPTENSLNISPVAQSSINLTERKKIRTLNITLQVNEIKKTYSSLTDLAENAGGYVERYDTGTTYTDSPSSIPVQYGSMTLRLPKENYDNVKETIYSLGDVTDENEFTEDVTKDYINTNSLLKSRQIEEERLLSLMENAATVEDLIKIEERLSIVRSDIENYQSSNSNWDNLVQYSTIHIYVQETGEQMLGALPNDFGGKLKNSFIQSINNVILFCQNLILKTATFGLPLLLFIIFALICFIFIKKKRKNKNI